MTLVAMTAAREMVLVCSIAYTAVITTFGWLQFAGVWTQSDGLWAEYIKGLILVWVTYGIAVAAFKSALRAHKRSKTQ